MANVGGAVQEGSEGIRGGREGEGEWSVKREGERL